MAAVSVLAAGASDARAADAGWTLTTADFRSEVAGLRSIDAAGVHVIPAGASAEKVVPFDQFLQMGVPVSGRIPAGKFTLYLSTGDKLGGEPVSLQNEMLAWNSTLLGEVRLPLRLIAAVAKSGTPAPLDRRKEDVVVLSNGDTLRGIVSGLADGKLTVGADAGNNDVALGTLASISFAATAGGAADKAQAFRLRFDDGSSIVANTLTVDADKLVMAIGKTTPIHLDLAHVTSIEQLNGPVSWLSSRTPAENVYVPFFGTESTWPNRMDQTVDGREIRFKEQTFLHGIGVHSYSRLTWKLDGGYEAFRTRFAIDGEGRRADVTVRVKLDGRVVYEQPNVRAGKLFPVVVESLTGATSLTLEVDFGANEDTQDRFNWIEPALLKRMPAPEPPAPSTAPAATTAPAAVPTTTNPADSGLPPPATRPAAP